MKDSVFEQPASTHAGREAPSTTPTTSPRHLVYVCLVFYPDTSASSLLFTDLFVRMAAQGTRVTVLCGFPSKDTRRDVHDLPRHEAYAGVSIHRCGLRMVGKAHLGARALAYGSFLAHAAWSVLRVGREATVVGGTDPPFTSIALWCLSRVRRLQYDIILLDLYPDGLIALGSLREGSILVRAWRALNRRSYAAARHIIVIGRDMATRLVERYDVASSRVTYIPHWATADVEDDRWSDDRRLLRTLGIDDRFVVQYSGNMGLWHDMESLVRLAERFRGNRSVHFLFVGKGRRRAGAETLARSLKLDNVTWLDFLPREELAESLRNCDAALISLRAGLEGVAVPSKLYGILASGRAVIAQVPLESEVAYTVRDARCGFVVAPGDTAGLETAVRTLVDDRALAGSMGQKARAAYDIRFTLENAARSFGDLWGLNER